MQMLRNKIFLTIILISNLFGLHQEYWMKYKQNFISSSGRVIDRFNQNITHTESIGYGMFFAVSYNDHKTFDKIRKWLRLNMKINDANLYGWKWGQRQNGSWGMLDLNNATDGDMWIAYSLLLAYEKWGSKIYLQEAKKLIQAIKKHTVKKINGRLFLLPAKFGFLKKDYVKLNPSYVILFIFEKFAIYDHDKIWKELIIDSVEMLKGSQIGNLKIHPDWIKLNIHTMKYTYYENESIFGFDSIRTPLFLAYQYKLHKSNHIKNMLKGYIVLLKYIKKLKKPIYQIDFKNHRIRYKYPPYGFLVVYDYLYQFSGIETPMFIKNKIKEGLKNEASNYYSYSLFLFADIFK